MSRKHLPAADANARMVALHAVTYNEACRVAAERLEQQA